MANFRTCLLFSLNFKKRKIYPSLYLCFHLNFSGNVDFTTPIGSFQAGGNLGLQPNQGGNGLLTNAVIALGVLSLVNTVATVASGWFGNKDDEDDKDKEDGNYDLFVITSKVLLKKSFIIMIGKVFETVISSVL